MIFQRSFVRKVKKKPSVIVVTSGHNHPVCSGGGGHHLHSHHHHHSHQQYSSLLIKQEPNQLTDIAEVDHCHEHGSFQWCGHRLNRPIVSPMIDGPNSTGLCTTTNAQPSAM